MSVFLDEYSKLLIIQYADKPRAKKQIQAVISNFGNIYNLINLFEKEFDLDLAKGRQLDIIGKIIGLNRRVPFTIPKKYFSFRGNVNASPMGNKFEIVSSSPFRDKFEIPYSSTLLNDADYRFFIRAKIAQNYAKGTMIDADNLSLQDIYDFLFSGNAYIVDNQDMSMTLYLDASIDINMLQYIKQMKLFSKPQGVNMKKVQYSKSGTFGFQSRNRGFGDKFAPKINSFFARKIIL